MSNSNFTTLRSHPTSMQVAFIPAISKLVNNRVPDGSGLKRLILFPLSLTLISLFLSGCGQKGELYLPEEAPSNTSFILYKANKTEENKTEQMTSLQEIEKAVAEDPQDY